MGRYQIRAWPFSSILLAASLLSAAEARSPDSVPSKAYFYVHSVADMDRSLAFYRDAVGLKAQFVLSSLPTDKRTKNAQINTLTNTPGASLRPAYFELPGNDYGFELLEFTDIERKQVQPRLQDPGASFLILRVRNLDAALQKLKMAGATQVGDVSSPEKGDRRSAFVRDLDGFYLLLEQPRRLPVGAPTGNIVGASVGVTVLDTEKTLSFYHGLMGLAAGKPADSVYSSESLGRLTGVPAAKITISSVEIPNTTFTPELWEFKGVERQPIHPRMQDPGAPQFTLQFPDPSPARAFLKTAGVEFLSPGVVYDPNGILILVRGEPPNN
jgi:catechol 2,3-dioxygenase-like lactoylglutathione lyase family enzyme